MMQFAFDIKHIPGIKNVVADLLSRLVKTTWRLKSSKTQPKKAVDEVVLLLLFHHELLPVEIYIKNKKVHNSAVGHGGLEMPMSRLAQQGHA